LVGRDYYNPQTRSSVTYSVGQPMGALTSWAMLAVTHHFIVQVASWQVQGISPNDPFGSLFREYAVLGDDIVIFDRAVAKQYHKLITSLGVECNLAKSVLSPSGKGMEFAKKYFYQGVNISPTPLSEFASSLVSIPALIEYGKNYQLSFSQLMKVAGFGYRVIGGLNKPILKQNLKIRYLVLSTYLADPHYILKYFKGLKFSLSNVIVLNSMRELVLLEYNKMFKGCHKIQNFLVSMPTDQRVTAQEKLIPGRLFADLYWMINQPIKLKYSMFNHDLWKDLPDIQSSISKAKFQHTLAKILVTLIDNQKKASKFDIADLSIHKREKEVVDIYGRSISPKMYSLTVAYDKIVTRFKGIFNIISSPPEEVTALESGFVPLALFRRLPKVLLNLSRSPFGRTFIRLSLNRLKWFGSFTIILSLLT